MNDDAKEMARQFAWDQFLSAVMTMSLHPGTTRDRAIHRSVEECAILADQMLNEHDKRFGDK